MTSARLDQRSAVRPDGYEAGIPSGARRRDERAWADWLGRLFGPDDDRYRHSLGVWRRACELTVASAAWQGDDGSRLRLACLLHDVGRGLGDADHHALEGARFLAAAGLDDIAATVAHHSGARFELAALGLRMPEDWDEPDTRLVSALTYLDRTTAPTGRTTTVAARRRDLLMRYGPGSVKVSAFDLATPEAAYGAKLTRAAN